MKLSEILTELRNGAIIFNISVKDSSKVIANSKGELNYATTLFQKKYVDKIDNDEIIKCGTKQTNISEVIRIIKQNENIEMNIRVGKISFTGIIEIDIFQPENLINWGELSRILAKDRSSITRTRISDKHRTEINKLLNVINNWHQSLSRNSEKPEIKNS
jgi:hypothetical protein